MGEFEGGSLGAYEPSGQRWMYLPHGWDTAWKAALANQASTPALIAGYGDSIMQGQNSTDTMNLSFFELFCASVLARPGVSRYYDYYPAWPYTAGFGGSTGAMPYSAVTGGSGSVAGTGRMIILASGTGTITFTTPYACTAFDIVYCDFRTGTWQYTVDGGGAVTVNTTGPNPVSPPYTGTLMKKVTVTGLANTVHTIVIFNGSATNELMLAGVGIYPSGTAGTGVGFVRHGIPQIQAVQLGGTTVFPPDMISPWAGVSNLTGPPCGAALVVLEIDGLNDTSVFPGLGSVTRTVTDGVTTNASKVVTSASAALSILDAYAQVSGAGIPVPDFIDPRGVNSPTQMTLATAATASASGVTLNITRPPFPDVFADVLRRTIQAFRRGYDGCSIVLVCPSYPDSIVSDVGAGSPGQWYGLLKRRAMDVAANYGCAILDIDAKWGELGFAKGFQANNNLHPLNAGHADIAADLIRVA